MPTPASPQPFVPPTRVSIRRQSSRSTTATSSAAEQALGYVLDRKLRKREGRLPPPRPHSPSRGSMGLDVDKDSSREWVRNALPWAAVVIVISTFAGGVAMLVGAGGSRHAVSGTVFVGSKPLPRASLSFHRMSDAGGVERLILTTGADGRFETPGNEPLPAGLYSVVVDAGRPTNATGSARSIPRIYRDATTTPLRVHVTESLTDVQLTIRR